VTTVSGDIPEPRPAAFATSRAVAAPKPRPRNDIVGIDDAVALASPSRAADIAQLPICAKQSLIPAPVIATETARNPHDDVSWVWFCG
jgi:hypothetical protein